MKSSIIFLALVGGIGPCLLGCQPAATGEPAVALSGAQSIANDPGLAVEYQQATAMLGGERSMKDGVLDIRLPRRDLWVQADLMEVPTEAGLASNLYFFRCSCGKDRLVGDFVLTDYEVNDVLDALRAGRIDVASVSPMFIGDKPRMMEVRFQAEGTVGELAKTLQGALEWIGDARTAKQPIELNQPAVK
jgi:hypothetical protein